MEVSISSGRRRESYVLETNRLRSQYANRPGWQRNVFPRRITQLSVVKDIYIAGEQRHVQTAISEKPNKSIGTPVPAYLEPPPAAGRKTGNARYNYCHIARPATQSPGRQGPRDGPQMRGSVSRDQWAGVSSDAVTYEETTVFLPDMPYTEELENETTVRWIYCGTDFVKED